MGILPRKTVFCISMNHLRYLKNYLNGFYTVVIRQRERDGKSSGNENPGFLREWDQGFFGEKFGIRIKKITDKELRKLFSFPRFQLEGIDCNTVLLYLDYLAPLWISVYNRTTAE